MQGYSGTSPNYWGIGIEDGGGSGYGNYLFIAANTVDGADQGIKDTEGRGQPLLPGEHPAHMVRGQALDGGEQEGNNRGLQENG